jgi:hypothetical protein
VIHFNPSIGNFQKEKIMKFLLSLVLVVGSTFAQAGEEGWGVKCFEREHGEFELAYIIKVDHHDMEAKRRQLELLDCTGRDKGDERCEERGELRKVERQNESCLVLKHHRDGHDDDDMSSLMGRRSFELCLEEQETLTSPRKLVPVTVNDDSQDERIWCEREILRIL